MKFAFFTHLPWPEHKEQRRIVEEAVAQIQLADELGYHAAWFAEHHFSRYGIASNSLLVASHVAALAKRIRLGAAVLLPPLHNPVEMAESVALLDVITNGRLDVGLGRGSDGYEYRGYGVPWETSQSAFREAIAVMKGLWTTPDYTHAHGQHYNLNRVNLVPLPLQQPHPPIYLAASRTQATLEYVASTGHSLCMGVGTDTKDGVELCRRFVKLAKDAEHDVSMADIPFFRHVYVAESNAQARKDTQDGLNWVVDMLQWRRTFHEGSEIYEKLDDWKKARAELPVSYDYLVEKRAIVGDPATCVKKIKELQADGIGYLGCNFDFGGMPHEKVTKSLRLFASEVMPHFK